ncbi:MAG TPA: hypothetical protein EYH31_10380 [Anaerolineae bacterium]|nr:hypothetical protein [Anaerolineae bacterium]
MRDRPELDMVWIDVAHPNIGEHLDALCPDVIVFDLVTPHSDFVIPFLREHPGLPLIPPTRMMTRLPPPSPSPRRLSAASTPSPTPSPWPTALWWATSTWASALSILRVRSWSSI